jgi:hypothetical protein
MERNNIERWAINIVSSILGFSERRAQRTTVLFVTIRLEADDDTTSLHRRRELSTKKVSPIAVTFFEFLTEACRP